ncbi:hypothetical protein BpHYR1_032491 [Brachionus plicatilis]|uniref:Uncharacterized protein n=1 Tax=Brachionus plicatilis TaxID=10195 RepID=A0A3M7QKW1_BRAPC|nr:hypothetical protein BpHYR1_032491 [Brachionus plicatilis]
MNLTLDEFGISLINLLSFNRLRICFRSIRFLIIFSQSLHNLIVTFNKKIKKITKLNQFAIYFDFFETFRLTKNYNRKTLKQHAKWF